MQVPLPDEIRAPRNCRNGFSFMGNPNTHTVPKALLWATLIVVAATVACSKPSAQNPQAAGGMHAMPVKVIDAKDVPVNDSSEYVAMLKSRDSAVIMPKV